MGTPTECDDLAYGQGKIGRLLLKHGGDRFGGLPGTDVPEIRAIQKDFARFRFQEAIEQPQQGGFAGTIGAGNSKNLTGRQIEAERMQNGFALPRLPADLPDKQIDPRHENAVPSASETIIAAGSRPCDALQRLPWLSSVTSHPFSIWRYRLA